MDFRVEGMKRVFGFRVGAPEEVADPETLNRIFSQSRFFFRDRGREEEYPARRISSPPELPRGALPYSTFLSYAPEGGRQSFGMNGRTFSMSNL